MSVLNGKSKNQNLKGFLFFLIVASVIWLLTNFSEDKEASIMASISYSEIPAETILSSETNKEVQLTVVGNGFQLLYYRLKRPTIDIPVSFFYDTINLQVHIEESKFKLLAEQQLNIKEVKSASNWMIQLDQSIRKKVPVIGVTNLQFRTGYRALQEILVSPDSLWVEGPSEIINTIDELRTQIIAKENLNTDFSEEVFIDTPYSGITYEQESVKVSMIIKEFTQKQIEVPLQLKGAPQDASVKLLPKTVQVSLEVAVDSFGTITADDFKIVCDFEDKIEAETILIPKIVQQPDAVFNISIQPRKIEYLIFK